MKRIVFALALLITSWSSASLTDGLVGYWPFDGDAKDYSGNGNNGNLHGVSFTNGRRGSSSAAHFDGNDYVSVPSSGKISRIFDFSVTAWMKINRYETASDGTKWCSFVSKGGDSIRQFGVQFGVNTNGAAFYQLVAGDRISCPKIPINTWTHIAVTRSGLNASLYINGVGVAGGTSKSYPEQHSGNLEIGRDSPGEVEYFHGEMSDVCLFNRALSAAEVSAIYNGGLKLGKVVFNANAVEVEGTMPSLSVLSGTQEKLPENAFRRHDGYVFQGWAKSKSDADNGIVEYQDEEEITIESDMTLYAVWQASLPDVVVHFNANGGVGNEMDEQVFIVGEKQKLIKNTYAKNGYVFQGWAASKADADNGAVRFCDEAEIAIDANMTLYAVWANPVLTLAAESANWSSGSITLCCTDADTSGAAHTYTLSYKDETTGEWNDVDGAKNVSVGADGKALLTDSVFSSRLGGIPPVKYRVKDENGRVTEECVTRTKYGVFVGLSRWSPSAYKKSLANLGDASNARKFRRLAVEQGSFDGNNITMLVDGEATTNAVSNAFADKARRAVAGDVCVFYFSTHGGVSENNGAAALAFYDGRYDDEALASDIARLDAANKGIAVIGIVHACHSVAMYDNPSLDFERTKWYLKNGLAQCSPNVAWITSAARVKESSYGTFNIFMLDYGWEEGFAGTGDSLTFGELAQYTKSRYDAVFSGIVFDHDHGSYSKEVNIENTTILSRVMAGRRGSHDTNAVVPATPQGVAASQGLCNTRVGVSWNPVADATAYTVFYRVGDGEKWTGCCWRYAERPRDGKHEYWKDAEDLEKECSYSFKGRDENSHVFFAVKAFNGAGVSGLSDIAIGWMDYKSWWGGVKEWLFECHPSIVSAAAGDVIAAAGLTAACGTMTVEKCYALGINPEDPNDDLRITDFKMEDGKPIITLNHTEDGSGNSFLPRVKTLGKSDLSDATEEWREVPKGGDPAMRFFKVSVEMP